jgi:hypothetical protein
MWYSSDLCMLCVYVHVHLHLWDPLGSSYLALDYNNNPVTLENDIKACGI